MKPDNLKAARLLIERDYPSTVTFCDNYHDLSCCVKDVAELIADTERVIVAYADYHKISLDSFELAVRRARRRAVEGVLKGVEDGQ